MVGRKDTGYTVREDNSNKCAPRLHEMIQTTKEHRRQILDSVLNHLITVYQAKQL